MIPPSCSVTGIPTCLTIPAAECVEAGTNWLSLTDHYAARWRGTLRLTG